MANNCKMCSKDRGKNKAYCSHTCMNGDEELRQRTEIKVYRSRQSPWLKDEQV